MLHNGDIIICALDWQLSLPLPSRLPGAYRCRPRETLEPKAKLYESTSKRTSGYNLYTQFQLRIFTVPIYVYFPTSMHIKYGSISDPSLKCLARLLFCYGSRRKRPAWKMHFEKLPNLAEST